MKLNLYRVRASAILPTRANPSDAGLDVFFCPETDETGKFSVKGNFNKREWSVNKLDDKSYPDSILFIQPGENAILPTGLKIGVPHGFMLQVCNRSSIAAKKGLIYGAHIIDSGYNGEIFIDLHNIGMDSVKITPGDKIAQLVLVPVESFAYDEISEDNIYNGVSHDSTRGTGALGSSDKSS